MRQRAQRSYPTLVAWRRAAGLTQRAAGARFGMSLGGYQKLEYGSRHPRRSTLAEMARHTGVPLETLVGIGQ